MYQVSLKSEGVRPFFALGLELPIMQYKETSQLAGKSYKDSDYTFVIAIMQ